MNDVAQITISRAFSKAARWQIIITVLISGISLLVAGMNAAISAVVGGASVIAGGFAGMIGGFSGMMARGQSGGTPVAILLSLLKAEAIRVSVIVMLLLVTFKFYRGLVPMFLILGLAGSALASGAGLRAMNNEKNENNE